MYLELASDCDLTVMAVAHTCFWTGGLSECPNIIIALRMSASKYSLPLRNANKFPHYV